MLTFTSLLSALAAAAFAGSIGAGIASAFNAPYALEIAIGLCVGSLALSLPSVGKE